MAASLRMLMLVLAASPLASCALLDAGSPDPPAGPPPDGGSSSGDAGTPFDSGAPTDSGFPDPQAALAVWSGCMDLNDWLAIGMGTWSSKDTSTGPCVDCHGNGAFGIYLNVDSELMFEMTRHEVFITGFFAAQPNPDGSFSVVPAYDKLVRMGQGNPGGGMHPVYNTNIDDDLHFQILGDFSAQTAIRLQSGMCASDTFPGM